MRQAASTSIARELGAGLFDLSGRDLGEQADHAPDSTSSPFGPASVAAVLLSPADKFSSSRRTLTTRASWIISSWRRKGCRFTEASSNRREFRSDCRL